MRLVFILLAVLTSAPAFSSPPTLCLRESATVESEFVRLEDVADLAGLAPALRESLASVVVGRAPRPGDTRTFTREDLRTAIRRAHPEAASPAFGGAESVTTVRVESARVDPEAAAAIEEAIRRYAPCAAAAARATCEIEIRDVVPALRPGPQLPLVVRDADLGSSLGSITLLETDPAAAGREIHVRARIRFFAEAVVARRAMTAQHPLTPADLEVRRAEVKPGQGWYAPGTMLSGRRAARPVACGEVLCEELLVGLPLVRARENVCVEVPGPGFSLRIDGQALEAGLSGDVIRIKNLNSGAIVRGRVTARGVAELVASAVPGGER